LINPPLKTVGKDGMTLTINHHLRGLMLIYGWWLDEIFGVVVVVIILQHDD
jgi:hypothetical protein